MYTREIKNKYLELKKKNFFNYKKITYKQKRLFFNNYP